MRPEHIMHFSLQLAMQFTELTDTWLNAPQALPEPWGLPLHFWLQDDTSVRTPLKLQEEQSLAQLTQFCRLALGPNPEWLGLLPK